MNSMNAQTYPDELRRPDPAHIQHLLGQFWLLLAGLPELIERDEHLLAGQLVAVLRQCVAEMMLALNGIAWPAGTRHLNAYLGTSQRAALEKTLLAPAVDAAAWIGQAVALVVIYRWYAPQLVERFGLLYPAALERETLAELQSKLQEWPMQITTD
jgi:hypothetical protein